MITESLEERQVKIILWKYGLEGIKLHVNMGKTKVKISDPGLDLLQKSDKDHLPGVSPTVAQDGLTTDTVVSLAF